MVWVGWVVKSCPMPSLSGPLLRDVANLLYDLYTCLRYVAVCAFGTPFLVGIADAGGSEYLEICWRVLEICDDIAVGEHSQSP